MVKELLVRDLMTRGPLTLNANESLGAAMALMVERRFRHVPIVDERDHPVGVISKQDLIRVATKLICGSEKHGWKKLEVGTVMEMRFESVDPETRGVAAARQILLSSRSCLLVIDKNGTLIGILTETDYLRQVLRDGGG